MRRLFVWVAMLGLFSFAAWTQTAPKPIPDSVRTAKTVAIVNDTRQPGVEKGATEALAAWGQLKVVDDPQLADIVLRFDKTSHHDGHGTQKKNDTDSSTSYGYEFSTSATVYMKAYYKDDDTPFYSTKTEDGKNKAGTTCIDALRTAWRAAPAPPRTTP